MLAHAKSARASFAVSAFEDDGAELRDVLGGRAPARSTRPTRGEGDPSGSGFGAGRLRVVIVAIAAIWIGTLFVHQVGDASAAGTRAATMRIENTVLSGNVAALERELGTIQETAFVRQQARAYSLGTAGEHAFILDPAAPSLAPDAPGSAASRLGPHPVPRTPLETWLLLLFGPASGS